MRIKYKAPGQFFYRRFWRVTNLRERDDGSVMWATNKAGKKLYLPVGMVTIIVGDIKG